MLKRLKRMYYRVKRLLRNSILDFRYGGSFLGGAVYNSRGPEGASMVINTEYGVMPQLFNGRVGKADVLVDVGCGKGRVINWWLSRGLGKKIIGVELDEHVAEVTKRRLRRYPHIEIRSGSILDVLP